MHLRPTALLFDLDDTLHDRTATFDAWSRWFVAERLGIDADPRRSCRAADGLATLDAFGYGLKEELFRTFKANHAVLTEPVDELVRMFHEQLLTHMPGLPSSTMAMLDRLADAGMPWGLVTNGKVRQQSRKIGQLGLQERAACIVISEAVGLRKPDPRIFRLAAERLRVAREHILFVGDHADNDIVGARATGMRTAWIRKGRRWPDTLAATPPDLAIDRPDDLLPLLGL